VVCVLAYDGLCTFEYGIAVEVFGLPRPEFDRWYHLRIVGLSTDPIRGLGGVTITADADLSALAQADLVIIPGWRGADDPVPDTLMTALRQAHHQGARIASICSGVFVLAATGLLDGQRATTHWRYADVFRSKYPAVLLDPDVLYVDSGALLTSAGSAAGLDLCLHIVRQDFGAPTANIVARRLVVPAHRSGGQRQFIPRPMPQERGGQIAPVLDLLRQQLDQDWTIERMAKQAGLSPRTLVRRMKDATGQAPQAWLIQQRVDHAISLLEQTTASLDDIATAAGFHSLESMRRHFRQTKGRPPSWYRPHGAGLPPTISPSAF
jgi:AraC family transcriptional activator FtrA